MNQFSFCHVQFAAIISVRVTSNPGWNPNWAIHLSTIHSETAKPLLNPLIVWLEWKNNNHRFHSLIWTICIFTSVWCLLDFSCACVQLVITKVMWITIHKQYSNESEIEKYSRIVGRILWMKNRIWKSCVPCEKLCIVCLCAFWIHQYDFVCCGIKTPQ